MAYIPRSSFIPKETVGAIPTQVRRRHTVHVFGLLGTLLFSIAIIGSLGIFFYNDYLTKSLEQAKQDLSDLSTKDSEEKIEQIAEYDRKLKVARDLLDRHIAPTKIFEELELSTKNTVQYTSFSLEHDPGFKVLVSLGGVTKDFASVALQKMQFGEDALFSEYVVQDIAVTNVTTESGGGEEIGISEEKIAFSVTGLFSPDFVRYEGGVSAIPEAGEVSSENPESISNIIPASEDAGLTADAEEEVTVDAETTL